MNPTAEAGMSLAIVFELAAIAMILIGIRSAITVSANKIAEAIRVASEQP